jgi:HEAT repeat protein
MAPDISILIADLSAHDVAKRIAAAEQLFRRDDIRSATIPLVRAVGDPHEQVREFAHAALEDLGEPAMEEIPVLAELLHDPSADIAYWAATLLGRAGPRAAKSPSHDGPQADVAVEALCRALSRAEAPQVQQRAAWALGQLGPAAKSATHALQQAAASPDPRLSRLAAGALAKLSSD